MSEIGSAFSGFFSKAISVFTTYNWLSDTLDILLLAVIAYYLLKIIIDTRAITIAKGLFVFIVAYIIVLLLDMKASVYIFRQIFDNILVIAVVLFAPELRKLLEKLGNSRALLRFNSVFTRNSGHRILEYNESITRCINSISKAADSMSDKKIGALIVFEKETPVGEVIATGTVVDAVVSSQIIGNIFYPKSPLHDGAAVIRNNRLYAAGCILPLTARNNDVSKELGTRHRAAIGMSEQSDALVLVVSEETGAISIAEGGTLHRGLSTGEVREMLLNALTIGSDSSEPPKKSAGKLRGGTHKGGDSHAE